MQTTELTRSFLCLVKKILQTPDKWDVKRNGCLENAMGSK